MAPAKPEGFSAAVPDRKTRRPTRPLQKATRALSEDAIGQLKLSRGGLSRWCNTASKQFLMYTDHRPSCVSNGARLGDRELNFELLAHALKKATRAREMAHQRPPETPQPPPRRRATGAGPPSLPPARVSPRAPPRRRKVPRRSESGTRRRTRPAGDAARSPSTCRRRCAPRAATRAPRCAGLTGPRKRCGGARTARAACAT